MNQAELKRSQGMYNRLLADIQSADAADKPQRPPKTDQETMGDFVGTPTVNTVKFRCLLSMATRA
jgi:hypothetical protein